MRSFAEAQAVRWSLERESGDVWQALPASLVALASHIGQLGSTGQLVAFFGAGVGRGAGLPTWQELIEILGAASGMTSAELAELRTFDLRDQARLVQLRVSSHDIGAQIEELLQKPHHALAHALLANLPAREFVTTNYDTMFESAWPEAKGALRVLPYDASQQNSPWLLKLHGSIGRRDMVVTRSDYLELTRNRAALAGIVKAMLITRHMLFIGYSLRDDDFHEVVDDVRTAIGTVERPIGTALMADSVSLTKELWSDTLNVVSASDAASIDSVTEGGRLVEDFLDRLNAEAIRMSPSYFLDLSFAELLTPAERDMANRLHNLTTALDGNTPIGNAVHELLSKLGYGH